MAISSSQHEPEVIYQLMQKESELLHLCVAWQSQINRITTARNMEWGPSANDLKVAKAYESHEQMNDSSDDAMDTDEFSDSDDEESDIDIEKESGELEDAEFLDSVEATGRMESFRF